MLICPKCNFDNELGRIFCHQCGAKLDLEKVTPTSGGGKIIRRKTQWTTGRIVTRVIELAILALIVCGIYLICQVPDMQPVKHTNAELWAADNKRLELDRMVLQKKSFKMEITATDLNAFIGSQGLGKGASSGLTMTPSTLQVAFGDGTVQLNLLGDAKLGNALSKRIFISYTGVPTTEHGYFELRPVAAAIGGLPIHPMILQKTGFVQQYFARVLGNKLAHEKDLLDQATSISFDHDRIVLSYKPKDDATKSTSR